MLLDERRKALENKYFRDEDIEFKIISRSHKLLGLWAAELMDMKDEDAQQYALDVVRLGAGKKDSAPVHEKIINDLAASHITFSETELQEKIRVLHKRAEKVITDESKNPGI